MTSEVQVSLTPRDGTSIALDTEAVALKAVGRVFEAWRLTGEASSILAGVSQRTWVRMRAGSWSGKLTQDQLWRASALVGLYKGLHLYFNDDLADAWVSLANQGPLYRGDSPLNYMRAGGLPAIMSTRDYVDAVRGGL